MATIDLPEDTYRTAAGEARLAGISVTMWVAAAINKAAHDANRELPMDDMGFDSPLTIPAQPTGP